MGREYQSSLATGGLKRAQSRLLAVQSEILLWRDLNVGFQRNGLVGSRAQKSVLGPPSIVADQLANVSNARAEEVGKTTVKSRA